MLLKSVRLFIAVVFIVFFSSWGFLVHRTLHQLAVYKLPGPLQKFFYQNMDSLVAHSVRPDVRRHTDSAEAPKHYINLEALGDSAAWKMPLHWQKAVLLYPKDSLFKYGYVPYHIVWMKGKLAEAFRSRNRDSILFYAADLGHYIADAHVPLHTTTNHDGQLTNQRGLHSLWESILPDLELEHYNLYSGKKATYLADPAAAIWQAVRRAHVLVKDVLKSEQQASAAFTDTTKFRIQLRNNREVRTFTPEFAKAYSRQLGNMVNDQLRYAASLIADFWYTAWVDAGKPDLRGLMDKPFMREDKIRLKEEVKAYKRNQLAAKKILLSRSISNASAQQ
jgi:hypothetical protein